MTIPARLLLGTRVRLTALTPEDVPTLVRWHQDSVFLRLFDSRPAVPKTTTEMTRWLEELGKDETAFAFAVRPVGDEQLLGYAEIDGIVWQHGVCGVGIGIGDSADWGKGYGAETARLVLAFAFDELNMHRVQATVFSYNERSLALVERVGFRREGTYREFLQRDGKRFDMHLYGLLRREWQGQSR